MVPDLYLGFKMIMFMCFGSVSVEKPAQGSCEQPPTSLSLLKDGSPCSQMKLSPSVVFMSVQKF